jgi:hypothetical protein
MGAIDQLLLEKTENLEKMAAIRGQIAAAKAEVMDGGEYSDPKWFAAANTALRYAGKRDQEIAAELARLKREKHGNSQQARAADFAQNFVDIAKLKLTGEQFNEIKDAAIAITVKP